MIKIKIEYNNPEKNMLEIRFLRGNNLIHNVFYDVSGLNEDEILELKKEAVAKFCTVFPDIPLKAVLQGFNAVDPLMHKYYRQVFPHGGWRGGGRPKSKVPSGKTEVLGLRLTLDEKEILTKILEKMRGVDKIRRKQK